MITDKGRGILRSSNSPKKFDRIFRHLLSSSIAFFTDGFKTEVGCYVGLTIHCPNLNLNLQFRISSYSSILTAEALAIQIALEYTEQYNLSNFSIFIDSFSTLQILSNRSDFITSPSSCIFKREREREREGGGGRERD